MPSEFEDELDKLLSDPEEDADFLISLGVLDEEPPLPASRLPKIFYNPAIRVVDESRRLVESVFEAMELLGKTEPLTAQVSEELEKCRLMLQELRIESGFMNASPKQVEVMEAFMGGVYKTIFVSGGNQSGKSFISARLFAWYLRERAKPGEVYWCINPNSEKSVMGQQRMLWDCLPRRMLGGQVWTEKNGFGSKNPLLVLHSNIAEGAPIIVKFKSQAQYEENPDSFESETVSGIWIDESIDGRCYQALQPRVAIRNGFMLVSTIPSTQWMWESFENATEEARVKCFKILASDNPAMLPEALERLKASITDPDEYEMRINGNFKTLSGLVFREFDLKKHAIVPAEIPKDLTYWGGLDIGWDHPSAFVLAGVDKAGVIYIVAEYVARHHTVVEMSEAIRALLSHHKVKLAGPVFIDPSTASVTAANRISVLRQFSVAKLECTKARRTQDIGEKVIVNGIRQMFRDDGLFVSNACPKLIRELRIWSYKRDRSGNQSSGRDVFEDKNNDSVDALKYVLGSGIRYIDPTKPRLKAIFT